MFFQYFVLISLLLAFYVDAIGRDQAVGAFGHLTCNGEPANNVLIKLYDEDDTDPDDLLKFQTTDGNGNFRLEGWTDEITAIDPKINIYHDCNDSLPCQIKFTIKIPDQYISQGKAAEKYFDAGSLPLEAKYPGQGRDCIHFSGIKARGKFAKNSTVPDN